MSQIHAQSQAEQLRISLAGTLTIAEVTETRSDLMAQIQGLGEAIRHVHLDVSAVPEMDSAGVQLLLALGRALRERGHELTVGPLPTAVRTVTQALGAGGDGHCFGFKCHDGSRGAT